MLLSDEQIDDAISRQIMNSYVGAEIDGFLGAVDEANPCIFASDRAQRKGLRALRAEYQQRCTAGVVDVAQEKLGPAIVAPAGPEVGAPAVVIDEVDGVSTVVVSLVDPVPCGG